MTNAEKVEAVERGERLPGTAVNVDECRSSRRNRRCTCGTCAVCGYAKHMGIHSGIAGDTTGRPWGHTFVPTATMRSTGG